MIDKTDFFWGGYCIGLLVCVFVCFCVFGAFCVWFGCLFVVLCFLFWYPPPQQQQHQTQNKSDTQKLTHDKHTHLSKNTQCMQSHSTAIQSNTRTKQVRTSHVFLCGGALVCYCYCLFPFSVVWLLFLRVDVLCCLFVCLCLRQCVREVRVFFLLKTPLNQQRQHTHFTHTQNTNANTHTHTF